MAAPRYSGPVITGVVTLKDVLDNVAPRNIIAFVEDINFYNCI